MFEARSRGYWHDFLCEMQAPKHAKQVGNVHWALLSASGIYLTIRYWAPPRHVGKIWTALSRKLSKILCLCEGMEYSKSWQFLYTKRKGKRDENGTESNKESQNE